MSMAPYLRRVLINLLENAVKYAGPQASISIDAAVRTIVYNWLMRRITGRVFLRGRTEDFR